MQSTVKMGSAKSSEILTIKEVAGFLKVTERTIYRLAAAKQIPAFKVGGSWRFSQADITEWIKQQAVIDNQVSQKMPVRTRKMGEEK